MHLLLAMDTAEHALCFRSDDERCDQLDELLARASARRREKRGGRGGRSPLDVVADKLEVTRAVLAWARRDARARGSDELSSRVTDLYAFGVALALTIEHVEDASATQGPASVGGARMLAMLDGSSSDLIGEGVERTLALSAVERALHDLRAALALAARALRAA